MKVHVSRIVFVAVALSLFAGCSEDDNSEKKGTLNVTIYGEDFIEKQSDLDDNWVVTYKEFDVSITNVKQGDTLLSEPGKVYKTNLKTTEATDGKGQVLFSKEVPVGKYNPSFDIVSIHVKGTATKGTESKTFEWTFDNGVSYKDCHSKSEVTEETPGTYQITIHSDHLYMNNVTGQGETKVFFQAIADADTSPDDPGKITTGELEKASIPGTYNTTNVSADNMWELLTYFSGTVGHVNGEHHCHAHPIPK